MHSPPVAARTHAAAPGAITVLVGAGQAGVSPGAYLGYAPRYVDLTVGDSVVFKTIDQIEPHTVTFGTYRA